MYVELLKNYQGDLKKGGTLYWLNCPFHHEKTPSLNVTVSTGKWKCFGCGKFGDMSDLVQGLEGVDATAAWKIIAPYIKSASVLGGANEKPWQSKNSVTREVKYFEESFFDDFMQISRGKYLDYLKQRGIKLSIAHQHELKQGSMLNGNFNGRILYPIRDIQKRIISIEGRTIYDDVEPRYYKESGSYSGAGMFAIDKIKELKQKKSDPFHKYPKIIIVEGVFDALSIWQVGFQAVCMSSSDLTDIQVLQLKKVTDHPIIILDGVSKDAPDSTRDARKQVLINLKKKLSKFFARYSIFEIPGGAVDPNDLLRNGKLKEYLKSVIRSAENEHSKQNKKNWSGSSEKSSKSRKARASVASGNR